MPDFTFHSPDGKAYTVSGPEGATKEQAFGILQQQLSSGTAKPDAAAPTTAGERAKAAIANLKPPQVADDGKPIPSPTLKSALGAIGTSTALGGALGAVSPELLTAAGVAVSLVPDVGPAIGSALMEAGAAARTARLASAAGGMLSGAVSETAGQGLEAAGANKAVADTGRLLGGLATPGVGMLASKAQGLYGAFANLLGKQSTPAAVSAATKALAGTAEAGAPANALHQMLQHGADADIQAAQSAGDKVMADARQRAAEVGAQDTKAAQKVMDDGKQRADQIVADARKRAADLNKASGNRMATAGKVLAQAEPALRVVGQPREMSDIGEELQGAVNQSHQAGLNQRAADYQNLKTQRDAVVQAKEQAGETLDKTPAMKDLKGYIDSKTLGSVGARRAAGGLAPVTDQGTLRVYQNVREAITNRRIQTGVGADGNPTYQTFKTSFEALDQVRRKLGEVVANRDVEGYSAIGKSVATQLYDRIGKVQREFVGTDPATGANLQQQMQEKYHDASIGLRKFSSGAGGKATALDRVDPERFNLDAKKVPGEFFYSRQSVRDLNELTGNPGMVEKAGRDYVAKSLAGSSAKQVRDYAEKNSDWLREVPGLQKSVNDYAQRLTKIESTAQKVQTSAGNLSKRATAIPSEAEAAATRERSETISRAGQVAEGSLKAQGRVLEGGGKQAEGAVKAAQAPAQGLKNILMGGERPEAVRDLLLNGKPEQTRLAARIASQTPEGQKQLEGSVRQITAQMTAGTLQKQWTERLKPMLQDGNMIAPDRLKALDSDIKGLLKAYAGKPPVTLAQRFILAVISTGGSNYVGSDRER
jgi:hypothetical protein